MYGLFLAVFLCHFTQLSQAQTILVHGDSLSAGYGINPQESWVALLTQALQPEHEVLNTSISGETTRGGLERLPVLLSSVKPDILILELGANDGLRGFPVTMMQQNLEAMVTMSQNMGASVIVVGTHLPPNFGKRYTEPFFKAFENVALASGSAYLPFLLEGVALEPSLMQSDGLHPTAEAQPIILQNVLPLVQQALTAGG
ncbi:acyl-CoA thioesterase-1 [Reinekea marinisedimentorum]|uniref:Acyl-CoA thioesterase-1 n=2 Tax=Reinekea marinisedimentorum TaxID=230495 RepID=A0A4R3I7P4_9GAMM|nr:acyl-CoA thioesterase-1 [Reinekea marinisedimentorum]